MVFFSVILVEIRGLNVCWRRCIRIIQETLDTRQDCRHIVRWAPSVLQNVQAQLTGGVYVWMEHLANELDCRWLVWILLLKVHNKSKGTVFKGSVRGSDDHSIPSHDIISHGRCGYTCRRICLHALEISHQTATGGCRHDCRLTWPGAEVCGKSHKRRILCSVCCRRVGRRKLIRVVIEVPES